MSQDPAEIANADYVPCLTKFAGKMVSESGRAWLVWLCHSAQRGIENPDDDYLRSMDKSYPWAKLSQAEKFGIVAVAKLNPDVARLVPKS